nr:immunoglobulin light chain junction region [Macaca mulatta]MOX08564.1 immunoglobulin light chain junction region [Macaca mulatta]MOX08805.1 immunoglobulin light chain junction region [Macaca mulatta]MOX08928.1 immunoglobulin light chain junction region [Macaca mulatta]MOX09277.1 immunoglobulin light chain junction region [Macaca mulatta]
CQQHNSNPTF